MRTPFTGLGTALVTPFRTDGSIDESAVGRLVRRQIDAGVHFVSPCGTTGEAPTLSRAEKLRVVQIVVEEVARRVPVLAGAGGYDTRAVIELAREYETALKQNPYWLGSLQTVHMLGWDPASIARRLQRIDLITRDGLRGAYVRYFPLDRYTAVSLFPEKPAESRPSGPR